MGKSIVLFGLFILLNFNNLRAENAAVIMMDATIGDAAYNTGSNFGAFLKKAYSAKVYGSSEWAQEISIWYQGQNLVYDGNSNTMKWIGEAAVAAGPDDTLFLHFIGHGNKTLLPGVGGGFWTVSDRIKSMRKKAHLGALARLVVIADGCYSGGFTHDSYDNISRKYRKTADEIIVMTSSSCWNQSYFGTGGGNNWMNFSARLYSAWTKVHDSLKMETTFEAVFNEARQTLGGQDPQISVSNSLLLKLPIFSKANPKADDDKDGVRDRIDKCLGSLPNPKTGKFDGGFHVHELKGINKKANPQKYKEIKEWLGCNVDQVRYQFGVYQIDKLEEQVVTINGKDFNEAVKAAMVPTLLVVHPDFTDADHEPIMFEKKLKKKEGEEEAQMETLELPSIVERFEESLDGINKAGKGHYKVVTLPFSYLTTAQKTGEFKSAENKMLYQIYKHGKKVKDFGIKKQVEREVRGHLYGQLSDYVKKNIGQFKRMKYPDENQVEFKLSLDHQGGNWQRMRNFTGSNLRYHIRYSDGRRTGPHNLGHNTYEDWTNHGTFTMEFDSGEEHQLKQGYITDILLKK